MQLFPINVGKLILIGRLSRVFLAWMYGGKKSSVSYGRVG